VISLLKSQIKTLHRRVEKCGVTFHEKHTDGSSARHACGHLYLAASDNLSSDALRAIQDSIQSADPIYLPSICVVEVIFLVEKKRIPAEALDRLLAALADADSALRIAPLIT